MCKEKVLTIFYNPPYDSPIEDSFAKFALKYFNQELKMDSQVVVKTICGKFRLDFVVTDAKGRKTVIECDGKEFHEGSRDEWRDAMILGSTDIDEIYRIRGSEINFRIEDVFYILSMWSPWLFDKRQAYNMRCIATQELTQRSLSPTDTIFSVNYVDSDNQMNCFYIEKRHKNIPKGKRQFWQSAFAYAQHVGGGNLDEVIAKFRLQNWPND
jgi:very-short-patch-repair endonuclease